MSNEEEIPCKLFDIEDWIPEFSIDNAKRTALCFRESLMVYLKNEPGKDTKPIGGYCILVESVGPQCHEFLIHVQSSMSIEGRFGGSKVTSSATSKFHCLEEKRTEFIHDNGLHEKELYIGMEENNYYMKVTHTCPCKKFTETKDLSFCSTDKLISEGVNILLMRYLALINYEGTLSFESITIDGEPALSNYACIPAEQMNIDDYVSNVYTIERNVCKPDGTTYLTRSYLTPKGRILRHNWLDVPYILKINPLVNPKSLQKTIKPEAPLRDRWAEDIEMFSKYLDKKFSKIAEQREYMADHPELKQMIADYVQTLLVGNQFPSWNSIVSNLLRKVTLMKPENVIEFTIQHFKAFSEDPQTWETSPCERTDDIRMKSQLAEENSPITVCNICGFAVYKPDKTSQLFLEKDEELISSDSMQSVCFKSSNDSSTDKQKAVGTESETDSNKGNVVSIICSERKESCERCKAEIETGDNFRPGPECPACLRKFNVCTKCSAIDKLLQKLKHEM